MLFIYGARRACVIRVPIRRLVLPPRCPACASPTPPPVKPFFVTTPIYYVNALPHVGHLFTSVLADAAARHARLVQRSARVWGGAGRGSGVVLATGTDEHGQKVAEAARARGVGTDVWCATIAGAFATQRAAFGVSADAVTRTCADARHARVVRWLWRRLEARGHIYVGAHAGWYCASDEAFLAESQTMTRAAWDAAQYARNAEEGGGVVATVLPPRSAGDPTSRVSAESGAALEWLSEDNFHFRLAATAPALLRLYDAAGPPFVTPPSALEGVRTFVASGDLRDLSISRPRSRVPWALPVPEPLQGDSGGVGDAATPVMSTAPRSAHSIYVWLDALGSYLTAARPPLACEEEEELPLHGDISTLFPAWPADIHVCGKDILKFHAIYWPAMCIAAGLPPPKRILSHGHWTRGRVKMSKSLGNVVDPLTLLTPDDALAGAVRAGVDPCAARDLMMAGGGVAAPTMPLASPPAAPSAALVNKDVKKKKAAVSTPTNAPPAAPTVPASTPPLGGPYPIDAIRFFLLREGGALEHDADLTASSLQQRASKECADTYGNLAQRLLTPLFAPLHGRITLAPSITLALPWGEGGLEPLVLDPRAVGGSLSLLAPGPTRSVSLWPAPAPPPLQALAFSPAERALLTQVDALHACVQAAHVAAIPAPGLAAIVTALQAGNKVFTDATPWKLTPSAGEVEAWRAASQGRASGEQRPILLSDTSLRLASLVYALAETLRVTSILLQPTMPHASRALLARLGFPSPPCGAQCEEKGGDVWPLGHPLAQWGAARVGGALPHEFQVDTRGGEGGLFPKPPRK